MTPKRLSRKTAEAAVQLREETWERLHTVVGRLERGQLSKEDAKTKMVLILRPYVRRVLTLVTRELIAGALAQMLSQELGEATGIPEWQHDRVRRT